MNTEKIEKLKKSLSNSKIPADLKPKIEAEIKRLEDLDAKESEAKEEVKPVAKKTTTRKPRATKTVAKKTSTRKPSQTSKPKRTPMSLAKEIRKEGESWSDARARASKMMKEKTHTATKDVESELDKLTKLVRSKKELKGQIGRTNLLIDAKRKAKPMGRRISKDGNVYYENRANRTDRGTYGKYHLAEGGDLMKGLPENFEVEIGESEYTSEKGNGVNFYGMILYKGYTFKFFSPYDSKKDVKDSIKRYLKSLSVSNITLDNSPEKGDFSVYYKDRNGVHLHTEDSKEDLQEFIKDVNKLKKSYAEGGYLTDPTFGNFQNTMFAKGGGVRTINGREYSYGRNWTNDHNLTNKGEEHEVNYTRKKRFELGGTVVTDLAGHTGGGTGGLNAGMPLDGFSNTSYTGLVGETGAMSSGEMFMAGGSIDKNFDLSGYRKFRTFNDLEEAKEYVDMDRKKYPRVKESVVIKEGNRYQVWMVPAIGIETGNRVYEAGGGLPNGVSQSYMVTEAFGNPAQHYGNGGGLPAGAEQSYINYYLGEGSAQGIYAKGGGVRKVGNREYSYGRNWTNDHRHVNQDEEHEVNYTRKGKFLGIFKEGGAIKNQYAGRTPEDIWDSLSVEQRKHFLIDHLWANEEQIEQIRYKRLEEDDKEFVDYYAVRTWKKLSGDVRKAFTSHVKEGEYNKGGAITNERRYVNKGEDYEVRYSKPILRRKGYQGKRDFMSGGSMETPKIYVADLEAYNNGRLSGVWLDLADYNDADELMEAIQDFLKTSGGEEYAIHDVEYVPRSMYSEYMGQRDFEELYEMIDLAKDNNLPLSVVQEVVSQYDASAVNEFQGRYDNAEDFAQELVDEMGGLENFSSPEYYTNITDTDRRLLAGEMADSYVDDIRDEDGGNRVIEEAGLDLDEYEEADSERREEMVDEAVEIVREEYYDTWYEGLSDPYEFLVEEQGMYSPEDLFNASFIRIDYEKLARDLEQDYTFIYEDGELYVFNIR